MNIPALIILLLASTLSPLAGADEARPAIRNVEDKLQCGDVEVIATSSCLRPADHETQCRAQSLQLKNPAKAIAKKLPHDGKPLRQAFVKEGPVLDAIATGWACIQSASGTPYILVSYTCVEHDRRPECAGTNKEWGRVFGMDGKDFTAGIARRSPALERIYRRLGLSASFEQGIQLQELKY